MAQRPLPGGFGVDHFKGAIDFRFGENPKVETNVLVEDRLVYPPGNLFRSNAVISCCCYLHRRRQAGRGDPARRHALDVLPGAQGLHAFRASSDPIPLRDQSVQPPADRRPSRDPPSFLAFHPSSAFCRRRRADRCVETDGTISPAGTASGNGSTWAARRATDSLSRGLSEWPGLSMFDNDSNQAWTFGPGGDDLGPPRGRHFARPRSTTGPTTTQGRIASCSTATTISLMALWLNSEVDIACWVHGAVAGTAQILRRQHQQRARQWRGDRPRSEQQRYLRTNKWRFGVGLGG